MIMTKEADNEKLLVRYLLGNLPEEQQLKIERMFLRDDHDYERLLALEDELFYDYAQGKLSPSERKQFEERFLASEENRRRAMLASALADKMSETAPVETTEPVFAERRRQFRWRSLKPYFSVQSAAMRFSLATLAIMLLVSLWLAIGTVRMQNELNRFRVEQVAQEDRLQQQARQERARADELNLKLKREMDENAMLKQELSEMQTQPARQRQIPPSALSLVLAPTVVRDQATGMKKLHIPQGVRLLKLQLNLKGEVEYKSYQAILLTADGAERWSQSMLRAERTDSGRAIILKLPSRLLAEGDYELILKGYASDGTLEETGDYYYFSIVRK
jgi:anti-sigma factor RsiW